ncbi:MAG: T9SS type A sorting domain-containing protein [Bacteroidia bacterium]
MKTILLTALLLASGTLVFGQKMGANPAAKPEPSTGVYRKFSQQLPPNSSPDAVKAAILSQRPNVTELGCDLQMAHHITSPGGHHFTFLQTLNGIPIEGAEIRATLTQQMRFMNLLDNLRAFSNAPAPFTRTDAAVKPLLNALLNEGYADFQLFPNERRYLLRDGNLIPTHHVTYTANTQTWEVWLADSDLSILDRRDVAAYCRPLGTTTDTTGNGMVFFPDPLTSSGHNYSGTYVDNGDADNADLNAQRIAVTLKNINWNGTAFELKGPYIELADRESPTFDPVTSPDGNFIFTRSQDGFEDVMVYYHIDTFQRYLQTLGFLTLQNNKVYADPHGLNGTDNSHYVSTDNRLAFGEGGVDDAEDADVVIHEYGHALSHGGSPFSNSGLERQGLDEGIGDYVATTYSRGISYNFWKNVFTWDGHNEFWPGRSASDPELYPPSNSSDIYRFGTIWVSTLMEVWGQIGKNACDRVFFQSLYGHAPNMTLTDAALVHIDADSLVFNGAHTAQYQDAFCSRAILGGVMPGQPCYVGVEDAQTTWLDWGLHPNPSNGTAYLSVRGLQPRHHLQYRIVDLLGREIQSGSVQSETTPIDLSTQPKGLYLVQLQGNGTSETKQLLLN